jgi:hypothetical protein
MKTTRSTSDLSPVIATARQRAPRHLRGAGGRLRKTQNNYIAENLASIGHNSGNRNGAGPPPGNENAAKTPYELRTIIAYSFAMRRRVRALIALRKALLAAEKNSP